MEVRDSTDVIGPAACRSEKGGVGKPVATLTVRARSWRAGWLCSRRANVRETMMRKTRSDRRNPAFAGPHLPFALPRTASGLLVALRRSPSSLDRSIPPGFDRLLTIAESLPLSSEDLASARHWIVGARTLWEQGETRAALYQVRLACRRLHVDDL
jgi:hypothetical protein